MADGRASIQMDPEPGSACGREAGRALSGSAAKTRYQRPLLVAYGNLASLTRLTGNLDDDGIIGTGGGT